MGARPQAWGHEAYVDTVIRHNRNEKVLDAEVVTLGDCDLEEFPFWYCTCYQFGLAGQAACREPRGC